MRLLDRDVHLLALAERERALLDILARALHRDREVIEREPLRPLEVKVLAELGLDVEDRLPRAVEQERRNARVQLDQVGLGLGALGHEVAQLALDVERDRLLGQNHALAVARRANLREDLPHAVGDVLAGHLDEAERRDLHHVGLGAARGQVHAAVHRRLDDLLDAVAFEQRLLVGVHLDPLEQVRRRSLEERGEPPVLLVVVDDRPIELRREDVAHHTHREVGLLEHHRRCRRLGRPLLQQLV